MPRIKFKKQSQIQFLDDVREETNFSWPELAKILKVHPRTLSDWKRAEYTLPEKVFKKCMKITRGKVEIPPHKVLPDFWSVEKAARKGGLVVAEKYGGPGTSEGRRKGGLISQQKRRLHPELYQHCNLRKIILEPRNIPELAEFFGIVLGDGGINSSYQVVISLNKENDKKYISFICKLIKELFNITPAVYHRHSLRSKKVAEVTISSVSLVEFLLSKGLKKGDKVRQQVAVPKWIKDEIKLAKSCLRGLVDTDGGVYFHGHKSHGCECFNIGLGFTNSSLPVLDFVKDTLSILGFTPKYSSRKVNINLYRESEVYRYGEEIGFRNPYHTERLKKFSKQKRAFLGGVR